MTDVCPAPAAKTTTSYGSGTGKIHTSKKDCNQPWDPEVLYSKSTETGVWTPPLPNPLPSPYCDPGQAVRDPNLPWDYTDTLQCEDEDGSYVYWRKYKCDPEYTTEMLKAKVDALSRSRLPTGTGTPPWTSGDPSTIRYLQGDESCASQSISKYRFQIEGSDPKKKYTISWTVVSNDGPSVTRKVTGIRGKAGVWYWPSEAGYVMYEMRTWPAGCPNGGTKSVTYTAPRITED